MSKYPNRFSPNREVIKELRLVMASNRYIFTQGGIIFMIAIVLGALPALIYIVAWGAFISLALSFEKPYQLLRALLPNGNWTPHLVEVPVRSKIISIASVIVLVIGFVIALWFVQRWILPSSSNLWCDGSLPCTLMSR